ncbi:hypothetical protein [Amycolatopsis sp. NPDC058986]|uniref:sunset domain-containing protein n=1 Tax=unclassified Amycolatopsis TaxID=2618356 RepID=UPI00366F3F62
MSIFGQVWLWSLLAFFIGVLLTWLLLVLPARKRVRELEGALSDARADAARIPANAGVLAAGAGAAGAAAAGTAIFARPGADEEPPARGYPDTIVEQEPVAAPEYEHAAEEGVLGSHREPESRAEADEEALTATQVFQPEPAYPAEDHEAAYAAEPAPEPEPAPTAEEEFTHSIERVSDPEPDYRAAATEYLSVPPESGYQSDATEYLRPVEPPLPEEPAPPAGSLFTSPLEDAEPAEYEPAEPGESVESFESEASGAAETPAEPEEQPAQTGSLFQSEPVADAPQRSMLEERLEPGGEPASLFQPSSRTESELAPDWFDKEPLPERSPFEEPASAEYLGEHAATEQSPSTSDTPAYAFGGGEETASDGVLDDVPEETPAEATQVLPKRQPRESPRGGFEPPRPIQPSMRPVERRDPELTGGHSGSLFEPSVQPNQVAASMAQPPEPPPAREVAEDSVPPGPFGPGSAMPRPGGGRPAEGFAVKASVTALRYCTEDSPQFPRMVAEVWFRTPSDAERVGFRPLT